LGCRLVGVSFGLVFIQWQFHFVGISSGLYLVEISLSRHFIQLKFNPMATAALVKP
jgi:hypothetical protein